jgi:hypothetical protein
VYYFAKKHDLFLRKIIHFSHYDMLIINCKEVNVTLTVFTALFAIGLLVLGGLLAYYWRKARSLLKENRQIEEELVKMKGIY